MSFNLMLGWQCGVKARVRGIPPLSVWFLFGWMVFEPGATWAQPPCCILNMSFERTTGSCFGANCGCDCTPTNFGLGDTWFSCPGWGCGSTDIGPNPGGSISMGTTAPTEGNTFLSMECNGPGGLGEGIAMGMCAGAPLKAGTQYCFTIDLITRNGGFGAGQSRLRIFGSAFACQMTQLLYDSPAITGAWQTYAFCFTPTADWNFLNFRVVNTVSGFHALGLDRLVSTSGNFPPQPEDPCILPVALIAFQGRPMASGNLISWTTVAERGHRAFSLERSLDGNAYEVIHQVNGEGESGRMKEYSYLDRFDVAGLRYYRLRQMDWDGGERVLRTIAVHNTIMGGRLAAAFDPGLDAIRIYATDAVWPLRIALFDAQGRMAIEHELDSEAALVPAHGLGNGLYQLRVTQATTAPSTKLLIQR